MENKSAAEKKGQPGTTLEVKKKHFVGVFFQEKFFDKGIGSSRVYLPLSRAHIDAVFAMDDVIAYEMQRYLLRHEGLMVGKKKSQYLSQSSRVQSSCGLLPYLLLLFPSMPLFPSSFPFPLFLDLFSLSKGPSSGFNVAGAVWMAKALGPGHTIVTVLCDPGNNYISKLFSEGKENTKKLKVASYLLFPTCKSSCSFFVFSRMVCGEEDSNAAKHSVRVCRLVLSGESSGAR